MATAAKVIKGTRNTLEHVELNQDPAKMKPSKKPTRNKRCQIFLLVDIFPLSCDFNFCLLYIFSYPILSLSLTHTALEAVNESVFSCEKREKDVLPLGWCLDEPWHRHIPPSN